MTEETEVVEAEKEAVAAEADEQQTPNPEIESKARTMGWVPQDEFRGDPNKWRPADEFVQRGEEVIGFIKKDRDQARSELKHVKDELATVRTEYETRFERMERMSRIALDQAQDQIKREYEAKQRNAVREGDEDAWSRLKAEETAAIADLKSKAQPAEAEKPNGKDKPGIPPEVQETLNGWIATNRWFEVDPEMKAVATTYHGKLMEEKPGLTLDENLSAVREYVKKRYPEKFTTEAPEQRKGSPVEGGGRSGASGGSNSLWSKVPASDKEVAKRQLADGAFKRDASGKEFESAAQRQEHWAKVYFGGEA